VVVGARSIRLVPSRRLGVIAIETVAAFLENPHSSGCVFWHHVLRRVSPLV
jgi:hypothetical protein